MKAILFAAGLGTRFKPWTDKHPKALARVNGKSLLQRNIEYLRQYGITDVMVNIHHFADQLLEAIRNNGGWGSRIAISDETATLLETGGGLKKASWFFDDGPFLAINADILTDLDIDSFYEFHKKSQSLVSLAVTNRKTSRYFLFNQQDELCGWKNTKTGEERISRLDQHTHPMAFSGIHIIDPEIFALIKQEGTFSLVDSYLELSATHAIRGFDHSGSKLIDVGKPEAVAEAERLFP